MRQFDYVDNVIVLDEKEEYIKAIKGENHMAFLKENYSYVLSSEDKDAIISRIEFYHKLLKKKIDFYNVHIDDSYQKMKMTDPLVFKRIIGLPEEIKIDYSKDIISQLNFEDDLSSLKIYCYKTLTSGNNTTWFKDDFKSFLLKNGIYFMYDRTKDFFKEEVFFPILFNEKRFDKKIADYIRDLSYFRLIIDSSLDDLSKKDINLFKRLDVYSFERRVDYFINHIDDKEIDSLSLKDGFKEKYQYCLKNSISCMISYLFDRFCKEVLKSERVYKSILSDVKIENYYVKSGENSEVYSLDNKEFFFPLINKEYLTFLYDRYRYLNDPLLIYLKMKLPYQGYSSFLSQYMKDKTNPFFSLKYNSEIDENLDYMSPKNGSIIYLVHFTSANHSGTYIKRKASSHGVIYQKFNGFIIDEKEKGLIILEKERFSSDFKRFFYKKKLSEDIYLTFIKQRYISKKEEISLYEILSQIDKRCKTDIIYKLFTLFEDHSFKSAVKKYLEMYSDVTISKENYTFLFPFFKYLFFSPLAIEHDNMSYLIYKTNNKLAIDNIINSGREDETYEPSLPFKYVSYGRLAYSFKETYDGKPYFCSCQKDAILNTIDHYKKEYERLNLKMNRSLLKKNLYIMEKSDLPFYVKRNLDLKKDISSQLHFKKDLCHLCNHVQPLFYEDNIAIDNNYKTNAIYETYIHAMGCKNNVFEKTVITYDEFKKELEDRNTHMKFPICQSPVCSIPPVELTPYFNLNGKELALLLLYFYYDYIADTTFFNKISLISRLSQEEVKGILFEEENDKFDEKKKLIFNGDPLFYSRVKALYDIILSSYRLKLSEKIIPDLDMRMSLDVTSNSDDEYPFVSLGNVFNCYCKKEPASCSLDELFFCSCDKEAIEKLTKSYLSLNLKSFIDNNINCAFILLSVGLPYIVIKKLLKYDDPLLAVSKLTYRDKICRRCRNSSHSALNKPFLKTINFNDNSNSEYCFVKNALAKNNLFIVGPYPFSNFLNLHDLNEEIDLDDDDFLLISSLLLTNDSSFDPLYIFFNPSEDELNNYLNEFNNLYQLDKNTSTAFNKYIFDNYSRNSRCLFAVITSYFYKEDTFLRLAKKYMKPVDGTDDYQNMKLLAFFLHFLIRCFINTYIDKEKRIGR